MLHWDTTQKCLRPYRKRQVLLFCARASHQDTTSKIVKLGANFEIKYLVRTIEFFDFYTIFLHKIFFSKNNLSDKNIQNEIPWLGRLCYNEWADFSIEDVITFSILFSVTSREKLEAWNWVYGLGNNTISELHFFVCNKNYIFF